MKMNLCRFDRAKIVRGFYTGYGGCVLNKKYLFWYSFLVGGQEVFVPRWHLKFLGYTLPELHDEIRKKMIENDRKPK
jgi:hypothetical protein